MARSRTFPLLPVLISAFCAVIAARMAWREPRYLLPFVLIPGMTVVPALLARTASEVVYACGPMGMLRAVAEQAAAAGIPSYVAVEESMACGIGVCMTCVLPVVGDDGLTRMVRSCVEGPVFAGDRVRWDALGTVPADAVGAPR